MGEITSNKPWLRNNIEIESISDLKKAFGTNKQPFGFVYELILKEPETGVVKYRYIGKKNLITERNKPATKKDLETYKKSELKRKRLRGGKIAYYVHVVKESDWKTYYSSNKFIQKNKARFDIERNILDIAFTDSDLTYVEAMYIMCADACRNKLYLNDGVSIRRFANKTVKD